jgi:hypothetical protein
MALSYRLGISRPSWLEREAEDAEVVVEPEDGGGAAVGRSDRADAVGEREREVRKALQELPRPRVELRVGVADKQPTRVDRRLEQFAERDGGRQPGVVAQPRGRLADDEVRGQQDVARVAQLPVVVADALVRPVAAPQEGNERTRVGVDDPQARSFGAP